MKYNDKINKMIKAIFLDFDDTIYSHSLGKIPESTIFAINEARKNGYLVFMCTGRAKAELEFFDISKIKFDGHILNNGETVYDANFKMLYMNHFPQNLKDRFKTIFNKKEHPVMFSTPDDIYINISNDYVKECFNDVGTPAPKVKEIYDDNLTMVTIFFKNEKDKYILDDFKNDTEITYWHSGAVDIVPKGTSKSSGIDHTVKLFNIDIKDTLAIGDGENDIEMIKHCGIGVAMGNSLDIVKEKADYIAEHINEDGLYKTFKKYQIIQ